VTLSTYIICSVQSAARQQMSRHEKNNEQIKRAKELTLTQQSELGRVLVTEWQSACVCHTCLKQSAHAQHRSGATLLVLICCK